MDCQRASILIMEYLDGPISDVDLEALRTHVEECQECRETFSLLNDTIGAIEDLDDIEPPEEIEALVMTRINPEQYKKRSHKRIYLSVVALMALLIIGGLVIYSNGGDYVGRWVSFEGLKDQFVAILVKMVNFVVLTLPKIVSFIENIIIMISKVPVIFYLGIVMMLMTLSIIEILLVKVFRFN